MKKEYSTYLSNSGHFFLRYGLSLVLIWIGILKFTQYEAEGIRPLAENSPFFSWMFSILSTQGFSNLLGFLEITTGLLIASHQLFPKLSLFGSLFGVVTFLSTLSFMLSTPGVIATGWSFPFISALPGQFLVKDFVLLGASLWTASESLAKIQSNKESIV
ncbi:YkgB family protein [Myroides fluvii]|uniref:YkgB family protein n=1 Tax=Myroides fluvii TaxID=2572594 RepID=UPI00131E51AE|nr:DUF417 family protein [Myroides fluvii]